METIKTNRIWFVGDTNGTFLSSNEDERVTNDIKKAKRFEHIGDALKACSEYNKNKYSFQVITYWN